MAAPESRPDTDAAAILERIATEVVSCRRCPRLVEYREEVGRTRRRAFRDQEYWARPVPGFGDPQARLLLVGLAPAAHGGNRTGRVFTGDRSGDWLYGALHRAGFANQPRSVSCDDGLRLHGVYVTAAARCAPPANKPTCDELRTCRDFLAGEVAALRAGASARRPLVVVALGAIGFAAVLAVFEALGTKVVRPRPAFGHLAEHRLDDDVVVLCSYHPSQQNTQTGVLTQPMFDAVFARARELLGRRTSTPRARRSMP